MASGGAVTHGTDMRLYHEPAARDWVQTWRELFELVECRAPPERPGFCLWAVANHLELRRGGDAGGVWIPADETRRRGRGDSELLRACGVTRQASLTVLDAMGGWGLDGLQLAYAGSRVTLLEIHPVVHALQYDLLRRSAARSCDARLGDGFAALDAACGYDVIYLDPMFPERRKGALPSRRMQYLAELTTSDPRPLAEWIARARGTARQRVVLKRRRTDPLIARPDWQIRGSSVRYDVYRGDPCGS